MSRNHLYAQHFLKSPSLVAELVGHSNIRKNDTVYDLGAGSGVITSVLARRCKQVIAVEIEPVVLKKLYANVAYLKNVTIIESEIESLRQPITPYKIFSNIPFNLSSQVVWQFTRLDNPPKAMYIIVQKQFARKLVPGSDHFTSLLSAQIGPWFSVRIRKPLRRTDFTPPPAVDTVLLEIKLRETFLLDANLQKQYDQFIERCFSQQAYFAKRNRAAAGISAEKIPSQLSLEEWARLFLR